MSELHDPFWMEFGGTPVPGRTPPAVTIAGGEPNDAQVQELREMYQRFRAARLVAPDKFLVRHDMLADGSEVHMWTMQDRDYVSVQLKRKGGDEKLPHGFVVISDWSVPAIHGLTKEDGWKRYDDYVPQAQKDIWGYNSVHGHDYPGIFFPAVRWRKHTWTVRQDKAHDEGEVEIVPFQIYAQDVEKFHTPPYYSREGKIRKSDGGEVYAMSPPGPLGIIDPEAMNWWPAYTDTKAEVVVLHGWRVAAPSSVSWVVRIGAETVVSPTKGTFARSTRTETDLHLSTGGGDVGVGHDVSRADLDEQADGSRIKIRKWTRNMSGGHVVYNNFYTSPFSGTSIAVQTCLFFSEVKSVEVPQYVLRSKQAYFEDHAESATLGTTTPNVLTLPKHSGVDKISWRSRCAYPNTYYWRAGWDRASTSAGYLIGGGDPGWYGVFNFEIRRKDSRYTRDMQPDVSLDIPWIPGGFKIFDGSGLGELTGRHYVDYEDRNNAVAPAPPYSEGGTIYCKDVVEAIADYDTGNPPLFVWVEYGRITMNMILAGDITAEVEKTRIDYSDDVTTTVAKDHPSNTINFTLNSRYMIDYDHRSQFAAWLRITVRCSGATWRGNLDDIHAPGLLFKERDPEYTIEVHFESRWRKKEFSKLLARGSNTRPCFEAQVLRKTNPYTWPAPEQPPLEFYMPPAIGVPYAAATQLSNFTRHQGVNPHYVGAAVDLDEKKKSETGIEYSWKRGEAYTAPPRWVDGMLYARTFKLADFADAFWLVGALRLTCSRVGEDDNSWYYFPALKTVVETQNFHIELRDGEEVQWSDTVPAKDGETRPERPDARTSLKLYQV